MAERLSLESAARLLDFSGGGQAGSISSAIADEQLKGAVALHNLLAEQNVAYLADEVGMGKTYVALGAIALFRHFHPGFRVLVLAPRQNIQRKWVKEWKNFVSRVVKVEDLRVKAVGGEPARALVVADSLADLVKKTSHDPDRDFFARLTSFSLTVGGPGGAVESRRRDLLSVLPWLDPELLQAYDKERYKKNFGRAVNCALPEFDLVVVDEGHNLKAGWHAGKSSIRNTVVACALAGRRLDDADANRFSGYRPKAKRVLFLSATPIENDFRQLWNQLDLFGFGGPWEILKDSKATEEDRQKRVRGLLIRRTAQLRAGQETLTKTEYRSEWRGGGVERYDEPLAIKSDRERLAVALVQKKVAELIGSAEHKHSFQVGLLASFESFFETAKSSRKIDAVRANDDGDDVEEKTFHRSAEELAAAGDEAGPGLDIDTINHIARDHVRQFDRELPHPKMDALVDELAPSFRNGQKSLVFVRRVASVDELQRKLEERYDAWLFDYVAGRLGFDALRAEFTEQFKAYQKVRAEERHRLRARDEADRRDGDAERSSIDSFFAWFFRGEGPEGVRSGASLAEQLDQESGNYAVFFEDNYLSDLLGVEPSALPGALSANLGLGEAPLFDKLRFIASSYMPVRRRKQRRERFHAFQIAGLVLLEEAGGPLGDGASIVRQQAFGTVAARESSGVAQLDVAEWLTTETLFTALRKRPALREGLWPEPTEGALLDRFRERERRRMLFAAMARKGHPIVDLFVLVTNRIGTLRQRAREAQADGDTGLTEAFLDLLEQQRRSTGEFNSWRELSEASANFHLVTRLNAPDTEREDLSRTTTAFGRLLRAQRPIGGMAGKVNTELVRQFRMPGYPLVLITTDLLKEGEDLHTFCSRVMHYGIAWMPSELEQRVGRVDRVGSDTERRLHQLGRTPEVADRLQVFYPHLRDTVEVLQVNRVYERLNRFLRMMHEGLGTPEREASRVDVRVESTRAFLDIAAINAPLVSAFPVTSEMLKGRNRPLASTVTTAQGIRDRFDGLIPCLTAFGARSVEKRLSHQIVGELDVKRRIQPFTMLLRSVRGHPVVRCVSPVGLVDSVDWDDEQAARIAAAPLSRVAIDYNPHFKAYDVSVEGDVLLGDASRDWARVKLLLTAITGTADEIEEHLLDTDQPLTEVGDDFTHEVAVER